MFAIVCVINGQNRYYNEERNYWEASIEKATLFTKEEGDQCVLYMKRSVQRRNASLVATP